MLKTLTKWKIRPILIVFIIVSSLSIYSLISIFSPRPLLLFDQVAYRKVKNFESIDVPSNSIQIVLVYESHTNLSKYRHAIDSVKCYSEIHGYALLIIPDNAFSEYCPHRDKFFRRHCVAANVLNMTDYTLFLDADIGVVNPIRKIQEYIDNVAEIIFYDRFYNQEVMAGSYLAKNTEWARDFLKGFADYEFRLPQSFHGTDNGALHAYLAEAILPDRPYEYSICMESYQISNGYDDLFTYEACIRAVLGVKESFGKIKILEKGTGWARDNWLTNSKWSKERDFMIHGWKLNQLRDTNREPLPITIYERSRSEWYNPLLGELDLTLCTPGNISWSYDERLITTSEQIEEKLTKFRRTVDKNKFKQLARIASRLKL